MAAYEVLLLNTAVPQIQAAQAGDTYVVPRDIAFSAALTLSAGTANGVPYLNGSKVLTTGSALTFDGTNTLRVNGSSAGYLKGPSGEILIGEDAAAIYVGTGSGVAPAIPINFGSTGTTFQRWQAGGSEQMRLTSKAFMVGYTSDAGFSGQYNAAFSGNVGIGTSSPNAKLRIQNDNSTIPSLLIRDGGTPAANMIEVSSNATGDALILNASGNLGLGVTPSAWGSGYKAFQVGNNATSVSALFSNNANNFWSLSNAYFDGTSFKYITTSTATGYEQQNGQHIWYAAASGTAGNAISFTQAMTLDASGNLLVGTTSASSAYSRTVRVENGGSVGIAFNDLSIPREYGIGTSSGNLTFRDQTANAERARITSGGNFKIGGSADRATTEGDKQLVIFDGTAPVGTLANGVSFYSASGEANVMDAAGNATLLSPHDAVTNEWIFRSKHTPTGKVLKIDVERLLKFVNDHFGLDAVHEFIED